MLNHALKEIQTALDILALTVAPETLETEQPINLDQITENVNKTLDILQNLENTLNSEKLTLVASDPSKTSVHYYQESWQKTA